jgi:hypothetical protein
MMCRSDFSFPNMRSTRNTRKSRKMRIGIFTSPGRSKAICPVATTKRSKLFQPSLTNSSFQCAYRFSRSSKVKTQVKNVSRWMSVCPRAVGVPSSLARESLYCASIAFAIKFAKMRRLTKNCHPFETNIHLTRSRLLWNFAPHVCSSASCFACATSDLNFASNAAKSAVSAPTRRQYLRPAFWPWLLVCIIKMPLCHSHAPSWRASDDTSSRKSTSVNRITSLLSCSTPSAREQMDGRISNSSVITTNL